MAVTADTPGPYATGATVRDLLNRYRERGLTKPITADVLARAGVSDSLIPRTLQSLVTLELIDDSGMPTDTLEGIRRAPSGEYQQRVAEWLRAVYSEVFAFVDPTADDETSIRDAFRSFEPAGQQARMVSLFLALCEEAGLRPPSKQTESATRQPRKKGPVRSVRVRPPKPAIKPNSDLPAPLVGLLQSLPPPGRGWSQETRDKFVATFATVLDYCFPIDSDESEDQEG